MILTDGTTALLSQQDLRDLPWYENVKDLKPPYTLKYVKELDGNEKMLIGEIEFQVGRLVCLRWMNAEVIDEPNFGAIDFTDKRVINELCSSQWRLNVNGLNSTLQVTRESSMRWIRYVYYALITSPLMRSTSSDQSPFYARRDTPLSEIIDFVRKDIKNKQDE